MKHWLCDQNVYLITLSSVSRCNEFVLIHETCVKMWSTQSVGTQENKIAQKKNTHNINSDTLGNKEEFKSQVKFCQYPITAMAGDMTSRHWRDKG